MGKLSLTCFEAPRNAVLPMLEDYYDWLRPPRLVGTAASLEEAANETPSGGTIMIKAGSSASAGSDETLPLVINKALTLRAFNGAATIGN